MHSGPARLRPDNVQSLLLRSQSMNLAGFMIFLLTLFNARSDN